MKNTFSLPPFVVNETGILLPMSQTIDWGTEKLRIPQIHSELGLTGKGIKVAIVDTAVDHEHPDLVGAVIKVINTTSEAYDPRNGHGTGTAGIVGARNNSTGILSAAPDSEIIAIKAMRESGGGSLGEIINGVYAAIDEGANIINMSLGTTADVPQLKKAVEDAVKAGAIVVASAGNAGGENTVVYPGRYDFTYCIGATNQNNQVSAFSSKGWQVDIAAPGERVLTTWTNKDYARVSGTSFSAPYVSGLFALFLEAKIQITHSKVQETAIDIDEPGEDTASGHGLIDPYTFIKKYTGSVPVPVPVPVPAPKPGDPGEDNPGCWAKFFQFGKK